MLKAIAFDLTARLQAIHPKTRRYWHWSPRRRPGELGVIARRRQREAGAWARSGRPRPSPTLATWGFINCSPAWAATRRQRGFIAKHWANRSATTTIAMLSWCRRLFVFFTCHGNLSQTAARLHIHRNTLTYGSNRSPTLPSWMLDDADARFSLQLALKLRPVMK